MRIAVNHWREAHNKDDNLDHWHELIVKDMLWNTELGENTYPHFRGTQLNKKKVKKKNFVEKKIPKFLLHLGIVENSQ